MKRFNPSDIEPKWQTIWADDNRYHAQDDTSKPKYYASGMFPYPSGAGMHSGHAFSYTVVDVAARFHRANGANVLNPMGWDTFGLPAENYAIKTGTAPAVATATNIANFKRQFSRMGVSIDWDRELNTSDPEYYRWTQWIFTKLFERGLAYQKESNQWWCPVDKTVLANEQVEGGHCWRCGTLVEKKLMKQWFFKITEYADSLLNEIPDLDWPDKIKTAQTNWIGRSEGAEITFEIDGREDNITVFSTRPDTIFGATFLVLAPEHESSKQLVTDNTREAVDAYISTALKRSEIERMSDGDSKTGVFTGSYAINPASGEKVPIWIADYVLSGYGTGAVMGVPAHDERDFAFAGKFELPVVEVIANDSDDEIYHGEGILKNSGVFDDTPTSDAREQIVAWLEERSVGRAKVTYKMRDWLISRQRYWGAPIPIVYCDKDGAVAVPEDQLPVLLPEVEDYEPKGQSVLAGQTEWVNTTCPTCGGPARRETDTMDGYACSSWYLLRYTNPQNDQAAWTPELANYFAPVDMYVGGDHAVAHLLYVRFWTHVFNDMGLLGFKEPVKKLVYHGYILAEDGTKMSKSKGNVIDPLEVIDAGYGADALRTFLLFLGPITENSAWSSKGIAGVHRFLNRIWVLAQEFIEADKSAATPEELEQLRHKTIKKVTTDIYRLNYNTAIAALMEYVNELYKLKTDGFSDDWKSTLESLVQLVAPFAPHMAAELWEQLGNGSNLDAAAWPTWDDSLLASSKITIAVQVNGKLRATIEVSSDATKEEVEAQALGYEKIADMLASSEPAKVIHVPGRLVSIVL